MKLTTTYKEVKNEEKNGIELYFDAIPSKEEREQLKSDGYKWNNAKKCWYKKIGATATTKKQKWQDITAFTIAKDFDLFSQLFAITHDYIQRESEAQRQKDLEYFYKKYVVFSTCDNWIVELETNFSIDSTLWYDDEQEAPDNTFENFYLYNIRNGNIFRRLDNYLQAKKDLQEIGCASGCYDYKGMYLYSCGNNRAGVDWTDGDNYTSNKRDFIRYLTSEEQEQFIAIVNQLREDYENRLKRYWQRHQNHVCWCGYWVNR